MPSEHDTIAAISTPLGSGGIGIVRISGPAVPTISRQLSTCTIKPREAQYCSFLAADQTIIDRGISLFFPAPNSYTGEHVLELHGHGGRVVLGMLLERVLSLGSRSARPGEFTERAYINGKLDLAQAEAVAALINSVSSQAARSAMRSLDGEFSQRINALSQNLINVRSIVEATLDFSEEEIDFDDLDLYAKLQQCIHITENIIRAAKQGSRLNEGIRMVIVGKPNVGKSSLLNRLAGRDAAIVADTPGTTRDIISENILLDGVPFNVVDTAGLRESENSVEKEGIRRALNAVNQADVLLLVRECGQLCDESDDLIQVQDENIHLITVYNKVDIFSPAKQPTNVHQGIYLSAKTGEGVTQLLEEIKKMVGLNETGEDVFMARSRHIDALRKVHNALEKSMLQLQQGNNYELVAEELRLAQRDLGEINGQFVADDLLGEIFSKFCIGK